MVNLREPLAGFWAVRLSIENAKAQVVQLIQANSQPEHLQAIVDDAVAQCDVEGQLREAVQREVKQQLNQLVARVVSDALRDPEVYAAMNKPLRSALTRALKERE